jgi:hypothetical protein
MPRRSKLPFAEVAQWATVNVGARPTDLTQAMAARFGVTRAAAAGVVKELEGSGFLLRSGGSTRPRFAPGPSRWISRSYCLPGIDESLLWERDFSPHIELAANVKNILHHGFTEMVNNANDHSGGTMLHVEFELGLANMCTLSVMDDGIGIFRKIADTLGLPDLRLSLLELSKGKFTSDKSQHSGEGVFFTSRMFDAFSIDANQLSYNRFEGPEGRLDDSDSLYVASADGQPVGTGITMAIEPTTRRTTREVFEQFTPDVPDDYSFSKTTIPVKLAAFGDENLLSRSQAKRLVAGIDQFKTVELDFSGVDEIGQAFADEVFRVFANAHPEVALHAISASAYVAGMIKRVTGA